MRTPPTPPSPRQRDGVLAVFDLAAGLTFTMALHLALWAALAVGGLGLMVLSVLHADGGADLFRSGLQVLCAGACIAALLESRQRGAKPAAARAAAQ